MGAPIPLRSGYNGDALRYFVKQTNDATQARRLLSLAIIYDGGVTLQIIRDAGFTSQVQF
ncbi:hypothetical protein [Terasakiella sp. SH-1]|uniref:hypothetical protein n=1 Tax=Terasakiella sp. SH-1 TaxID=2560057 RepID=UPI001073237D|nr:hypothetical protein [Terasakiella sp. SH-1]